LVWFFSESNKKKRLIDLKEKENTTTQNQREQLKGGYRAYNLPKNVRNRIDRALPPELGSLSCSPVSPSNAVNAQDMQPLPVVRSNKQEGAKRTKNKKSRNETETPKYSKDCQSKEST
jgi:hypothetical protein